MQRSVIVVKTLRVHYPPLPLPLFKRYLYLRFVIALLVPAAFSAWLVHVVQRTAFISRYAGSRLHTFLPVTFRAFTPERDALLLVCWHAQQLVRITYIYVCCPCLYETFTHYTFGGELRTLPIAHTHCIFVLGLSHVPALHSPTLLHTLTCFPTHLWFPHPFAPAFFPGC